MWAPYVPTEGKIPLKGLSLKGLKHFGGKSHPTSGTHPNSVDLHVPDGDYQKTWKWIQIFIQAAGRKDSPARITKIYLDDQKTIDTFGGWVLPTPSGPKHTSVVHIQFESKVPPKPP
jgi:hypothetical protein